MHICEQHIISTSNLSSKLESEHGSMITAIERHSKEDSCWLLIAAHASDLYRKSIRSPDLINLLRSASSHEDLLLS